MVLYAFPSLAHSCLRRLVFALGEQRHHEPWLIIFWLGLVVVGGFLGFLSSLVCHSCRILGFVRFCCCCFVVFLVREVLSPVASSLCCQPGGGPTGLGQPNAKGWWLRNSSPGAQGEMLLQLGISARQCGTQLEAGWRINYVSPGAGRALGS